MVLRSDTSTSRGMQGTVQHIRRPAAASSAPRQRPQARHQVGDRGGAELLQRDVERIAVQRKS